MKRMIGSEALKQLMDGKTLYAGGRYYRFNKEKNEVQYSDDNKEWKTSGLRINDFLDFEFWELV